MFDVVGGVEIDLVVCADFARFGITGGDVRFYGGYYSAADNAESGKIDAYNQVNLYTAYNFKQGRISLYADNVFNRRRPIFISSADRQDALYQRPRSVGVSVEWKF